MTPPRRDRLPVFLNLGARRAGLDCAQRVAAGFANADIDARIECCGAGRMVEALRALRDAGAPRVVVGGGDGTVSAAARELAGSGVELGVLPIGTLNHFARDAGVPLEIDDAVATIARGRVAEVDVGEVNGLSFVNNLSLGMYPAMVQDREEQRRRLGRGKWTAAFWAALATLRRHPFLGVSVRADGVAASWRTPQVVVGNNPYEIEGARIGARARIDRGLLALYVVRCNDRLGLWRWVVRAMLARLTPGRDYEQLATPSLTIESRHARMRVALDGELAVLQTPLVCTVRPRALRVLTPAEA